MVMGALGEQGEVWLGSAWGAVTGNPSFAAVTPSCPFFPQNTQRQPRLAAASLLEPRCAWRVGRVWLCQL